MKRILTYLLLMLFIASCGNSYEEQKRLTRAERVRLHYEDSLALKIAVMPTLDCLPLFVARDCEMYDTARLDLRLKYYTSQMDCDTAIIGKSVEGVISDLVRTERMKSNGVSLYYLTSTNAYWQLLTNKKARIKRLDQLGDKMVAMSRNSATDLLTDVALNGVKTSSIVFKIQINDVNIRLSMLLNNEMDAMWLTEPFASLACNAQHSIIFDSRDKKVNLGVLAFRNDMISDNYRQNQIRELTKSYNAACDSINKQGIAHYSSILHKYYKLTDKEISTIKKVKFNHVSQPRKVDIDFAKYGK